MDNISKLITDNLTLIGSLLTLGILFLIVTFLGEKMLKRVKLFLLFIAEKREKLDLPTSELLTSIKTILIELRISMDADRAYIYEFHNGEKFASNNLRWKLTQTHETCGDGISYEGRNLQNMDVTLLWDSIRVFYSKSENDFPPGITRYRKNPYCQELFCNLPKATYLIDVEKMNHNLGQSKVMLSKMGINYSLWAPILDSEGTPLGFVGVDYCGDDPWTDILNKDDFETCRICKVTSEIALAWELNPKNKQKLLEAMKNQYDGKPITQIGHL